MITREQQSGRSEQYSVMNTKYAHVDKAVSTLTAELQRTLQPYCIMIP